jgi:serine/threonine-protein kinase HipA
MGRRSHSTTLAVWMNGEHVGVWVTAANGALSFVYDDAWIDSKIGRPLSLSLPMRPSSEPYTGPVLEAFFDNLLPDNRDIRSRLCGSPADSS